MTWKLEPQKDNNGQEVGIGGVRVGWLVEVGPDGQPLYLPGTKLTVRALVDWLHGERLRDYLNGDWGMLPGANTLHAMAEERRAQPYLDMERIPPA